MQHRRLETLDDYDERGFSAHVTCSCGRIELVPICTLRAACARIGAGETIAAIAPHLRCQKCGARSPTIIPFRAPY
ncbi:hypothetical protein [Sphingomonas sp. BK580]|uniref:hypothetical protein n=1 Tax=Sphingomonas sp. BK580 TaxID=2586972 RepID=UPI00160D4276|nr:hypothetical protein [Sphingomonas sp. BK580]MBB3691439.1 hypothetical protein [Sphingomonas sp. BK580]